MKWLTLLFMLCNSARADVLLDLMYGNYEDDEEEYEESSYEADHYSWKLQESDELIIIYDDRCSEWQE
jgi:hypothetical protein